MIAITARTTILDDNNNATITCSYPKSLPTVKFAAATASCGSRITRIIAAIDVTTTVEEATCERAMVGSKPPHIATTMSVAP